MNFTKFYSVAIAMLLIIASSVENVNANSYGNFNNEDVSISLGDYSLDKSGPRDIILTYASVTVVQPAAETLFIKILDGNGQLVYQVTTNQIEHTLSTEGWVPGNYIVETVNQEDDYQEFHVTIE